MVAISAKTAFAERRIKDGHHRASPAPMA
jgi:hypothetical protein